jgi:DUF1680 family protein
MDAPRRANEDSGRAGGGALRTVVVDTSRSPYARLRPVPLAAVRIDDGFWTPRLRTVRQVTLRQQYEQCERTGRLDNFRRAAGKKQIDFQGRYYDDSDVYKWLEAASFALAGERDPELEGLVDAVVDDIAAAQSPDGYLNTYFTFERGAERWTDLTNKHELYCAGHFLQAAIAHHRATGKRTALDVALRLADHICATFGPRARRGTDGHEEIELAMVELYRATGDRRYLDQAVFFLDQRGQTPPVLSGSPYHQDHLPVREQAEITGHAVRATYLACGMADVVAETGEGALRAAVERLWQSAFTRKAYVTGGLGSRWQGEAFGDDYELPNERAYAETCAAIGGFMWNWRMLSLTGEARFTDWMETALYNGILAGLSLDGTSYFYQNPLADRGGHRRRPWFGTACCPPNIARLLMSLPGYLYSTSPEGLWVHLYAASAVRVEVPGLSEVALRIETRYPWDGAVRLAIEHSPEAPWTLFLRLPGWCTKARLAVTGVAAEEEVGTLQPGTYAALRRTWRRGDVVELALPMPVRHVVSHPHVLANTARVALTRGPLVYCVEGADHPDADVWDLELPADADLAAQEAPALLGGVVVLRGEVLVRDATPWANQLYCAAADQPEPAPRLTSLTAIPYYAWANRAPGPMQVWLKADRLRW